MSFSADAADERVLDVRSTDDALSVSLQDGRVITVPLAWYPRLLDATPAQRRNWKIAGGGYGIHWPDLGEDLSIKSMLLGNKSGESQSSLERWLESRRKGKKLPVKTLPLPAWAKQKGKVETRKFAKGNI